MYEYLTLTAAVAGIILIAYAFGVFIYNLFNKK